MSRSLDRALCALSLVALASGCAAAPDRPRAAGPGHAGRADEGAAGSPGVDAARSFHDDPRFVLRHRLDVAGAPGHVVTLSAQPFSHRSERWQVFPFSTYGQSTHRVRVDVADPAMNARAKLWLFGPRRSDGSWDAPRRVDTEGATLELSFQASDFGQWALVVGPADAAGFLPRYPGSKVTVSCDDERQEIEEEEAYLEYESAERVFLALESGRRLRVLEPITAGGGGGDGAGSTDVLWVESEEGEALMLTADAWARSQWWLAEDGDDDALRLGMMNEYYEGVLTMVASRAPHELVDYLVLDAIGADGRRTDEDPVIVTVIPDGLGEREIVVVDDERCDRAAGGSCRMPVFLTDGGHEAIPDEVLDRIVESYKASHIDLDEPSTYDLSISCTGVCAPELRPTRHPVYFAHGFNSSKETWEPLIGMLEADPAWRGWVFAESVPGAEPVAERTEHLRRNLRDVVARLEAAGVRPHGDEEYVRLNVVAHSMGGLDARYLLGHERFNNPACHVRSECVAADGSMEPCCGADARGAAIEWRDRIASVTTLSTPHCGTSFASWSMAQVRGRLADWLFRKVARFMFGMDSETQQDLLLGTLYALSKEFCEEVMQPHFHEPVQDRSYSFACATGEERCERGALPTDPVHLPVEDAARPGRHLLPAPTTHPTFFSWGSRSCITGTCGDALTPMLALPYRIVKEREGDNDGVVSTASSGFGVFMGIRDNDHFRWTALRAEEGGVGGFVRSLFGTQAEPTDRFHRYWLGELARAGY